MFVSKGVRFQKSRIIENTSTNFIGKYKGRKFFITSKHNYGRALYFSQTRFDIVVENEDTGDTILSVVYDCSDIKQAVKYAIKSTER